MSEIKGLIKALKNPSQRQKPATPMRKFYLRRDEDETGISGTGVVGEGVEFSDGTCVLRWLTETASTTTFASKEDLIAIHGHEGRTKLVFDDEVKKAELEGLIGKLQKAIASSEVSGIDINTAEYSMDASQAQGNPWTEKLRLALSDFQLGEPYRKIPLEENFILEAAQEDNGIYDGVVKNNDDQSGEYGQVLFTVKKMPLDQMIQALTAKEFISPKKIDSDKKLRELLDAIKPIVNVNINPGPSPEPPPAPQAEKSDVSPQPEPLMASAPSRVGLQFSEGEHYYVTFDGDNIGNQVALAEEQDDEAAIHHIQERIRRGQDAFEEWVKTQEGIIVELGGDEGLAKVPKASSANLEQFRDRYKEVTGGFTATMGVGERISQATKARMLGKLTGKNKVQWFDEKTKDELKQKVGEADLGNEAKKLRDAGFGKGQIGNLVNALKKAQ